MPSMGGLLVLLGIQQIFKYVLTADRLPLQPLALQVGLSSGLKRCFNLPTVSALRRSGYLHKAVVCQSSVSRFCALQFLWPHARGKPREPS